MLNRYLRMKKDEHRKPRDRRPYLTTKCNSLPDAEEWRLDILKEIGKKVTQIQNEGLGEHVIRDLNDEINKLLREKRAWERRIIEMGGPNYFSQSARLEEESGESAIGSSYKYFGAARKLKGVRDLFYEKPAASAPRKTRGDLYKMISSQYYGLNADEDSKVDLEELEAEAQKTIDREFFMEWSESMRQNGGENAFVDDDDDEDESSFLGADSDADSAKRRAKKRSLRPSANIPEVAAPLLPSKEEIERAILAKRKEELMKRYLSESLKNTMTEEEKQVKAVLGKI
eukprot:TRINITY_DN5075_c0_g1_i1.p1 TRINITY_DN5075_c0_g1~~TRINITY_DN5075_c0_g1_i1.p1  ORF type:complete len:300 (+),score=131.91 TRINITY_DN5075_c0_g1_i1:43-900(+)